jgi:acetyltransferase
MNFEAVLQQARSEGRDLLNEVEAKQLLAQAGVPVVETLLATTAEEAKQQAEGDRLSSGCQGCVCRHIP